MRGDAGDVHTIYREPTIDPIHVCHLPRTHYHGPTTDQIPTQSPARSLVYISYYLRTSHFPGVSAS